MYIHVLKLSILSGQSPWLNLPSNQNSIQMGKKTLISLCFFVHTLFSTFNTGLFKFQKSKISIIYLYEHMTNFNFLSDGVLSNLIIYYTFKNILIFVMIQYLQGWIKLVATRFWQPEKYIWLHPIPKNNKDSQSWSPFWQSKWQLAVLGNIQPYT